jgi:ubiquinone/menaquinone biosynthesis C-methylase UbiE
MEQITDYWNHNVHYQPVIIGAVPPGCRDAIDVGCGDGMLVGKLARRCATVTGIDRDARMIGLARDRCRDARNTSFLEADFAGYPFDGGSFDFACANTALHHMDFEAALAKMATILRPGGRLAVVGLADNGSPADWIISVAGIPVVLSYRAIRGKGSAGAPVMDADMTWAQARETARRVLPGVRYRRHLLWRYSLIWGKPALA